MSGSRRPNRSAISPKTIAPIGRIASVSVMASAMRGRTASSGEPGKKACARSSMTSVRMKKSKASSVQPRNPASTALRWLAASVMCGAGYQGFVRACNGVRGATPPGWRSETEAGAEVEPSPPAVERMGHVEIQLEHREDDEQAAPGAAFEALGLQALPVGSDGAGVEEDVVADV